MEAAVVAVSLKPQIIHLRMVSWAEICSECLHKENKESEPEVKLNTRGKVKLKVKYSECT
jgi:hypothetical protein